MILNGFYYDGQYALELWLCWYTGFVRISLSGVNAQIIAESISYVSELRLLLYL